MAGYKAASDNNGALLFMLKLDLCFLLDNINTKMKAIIN